ncbi:hypothetical protein TNCT_168011 [Trichonephila clavata]|uniref:Uncharacterized protein n=1 Tax=Trichonephila clavata TaxID=2740835 RepID=A0A8X6HHQ1_TRICU|nr:hypothetical protein TNCT_168011 [Trichonephila clavata]
MHYFERPLPFFPTSDDVRSAFRRDLNHVPRWARVEATTLTVNRAVIDTICERKNHQDLRSLSRCLNGYSSPGVLEAFIWTLSEFELLENVLRYEVDTLPEGSARHIDVQLKWNLQSKIKHIHRI